MEDACRGGNRRSAVLCPVPKHYIPTVLPYGSISSIYKLEMFAQERARGPRAPRWIGSSCCSRFRVLHPPVRQTSAICPGIRIYPDVESVLFRPTSGDSDLIAQEAG